MLSCFLLNLAPNLFFAGALISFRNLTGVFILSRAHLSLSRALCSCRAQNNSRHAPWHAPITLECFLLPLSYQHFHWEIILRTDHLSLIKLNRQLQCQNNISFYTLCDRQNRINCSSNLDLVRFFPLLSYLLMRCFWKSRAGKNVLQNSTAYLQSISLFN